MRQKIIPSIIAKNQKELDRRISKVEKHFSLLQLDVMDGKFVKNTSFDFDFKLPKGLKYEAQLMVGDPVSWIEKHGRKVDVVIFHIEPVRKDVRKIIRLIQSKKKKVGIAIKPRTKIEELKPYLRFLDMVLIMSVNPGSYGGRFLPSTLKKVKALRKIKPDLNIEVDGGISDKTISLAHLNGSNMFVLGSYFQKSRNVSKSLSSVKLLLKGNVKKGVKVKW